MTKKEIADIYKKIKEYYDKYLKSHGVHLPNLKYGDRYTKDALILIYLAQGYPKTTKVTKEELTKFIKNMVVVMMFNKHAT